ncbi:PP2C family serine/threonine-protein phosphatase [Ideonella sp.]|uniref:PP2C family protein-serine/threonine phosphatase n=1 Tax=Ideonella sp. TaxID=1929293 RepID=UPI0035AFF429
MLLEARTRAMPRISLASCSEIGARRANEDDVRSGHVGSAWYAVLADGAGGHRNGAVASARAVQALEARSVEGLPFWSPEVLTAALHGAHAEVLAGQGNLPLSERMLTTVVVLWVDAARQQALWSHVGDSRLYRLRRGSVDFVSRDDSVVQDLLDAGLLTASQARKHPHKNQLVAALGLDEQLEPHTLASPAPVEEGDAYLLCSDGWWDSLSEPQIIETLNNADTPQHWLQLMGDCIRAQHTPNQDNYSAIALWVGDPWDRS